MVRQGIKNVRARIPWSRLLKRNIFFDGWDIS